jgi:hypothetical protein
MPFSLQDRFISLQITPDDLVPVRFEHQGFCRCNLKETYFDRLKALVCFSSGMSRLSSLHSSTLLGNNMSVGLTEEVTYAEGHTGR